ncbi:hypothetical protein Lser_V15G23964 [Lactuca serriola]
MADMAGYEGPLGGAPVREKEIGATSVQCPMLNSPNYIIWALRMKVVLRIQKAWTAIDPGTEKNEVKDYLAMGLLYQVIPGDFDYANRRCGVLKGKLSGLASKSVALGEVIDETKLVKKFLNSLPREKFIHIVASLEHVLDLKTNGFEDVVGRLKAYEEEIREEDIGGKDQVKVLFVDHGGSTNWKSQKGTKGKGPNGSNNVNGYNGSGGSNSANRASDGGKVKQQWPNNNQKLNQPMNRKSVILFQDKRGQQGLMTEIYYILDLKNNIISLGQATESGCDIRMKDNYLTMYDVDNCLLMKVQRTPNRLYKIKLQIRAPICLHLRLNEDMWRCHARLGHINFESMKKMSKKGLVKGLPQFYHENQLCESCFVGKQTRKSFLTMTTYKAKRPLELVHGDLCGPITPTTKGQNRYIFTRFDDFS